MLCIVIISKFSSKECVQHHLFEHSSCQESFAEIVSPCLVVLRQRATPFASVCLISYAHEDSHFTCLQIFALPRSCGQSLHLFAHLRFAAITRKASSSVFRIFFLHFFPKKPPPLFSEFFAERICACLPARATASRVFSVQRIYSECAHSQHACSCPPPSDASNMMSTKPRAVPLTCLGMIVKASFQQDLLHLTSPLAARTLIFSRRSCT